MRKTVGLCVLCLCGAVRAAGPSADFSVETGPFRRALHSSGFAPKSTSAGRTAEEVKALNFEYVRTHDLALINPGQRVVDTAFIFPLPHLDAKDPKNYCFKPTDHLLKLSRDIGLKIFYRLGPSIEHSGPDVHFNTLIPDDFNKQAEVFAGTIRHYTRGWADGFDWDIRYWEIWNEPDGFNNMWCLPDGDGGKGATEDERKADRARRDAKRRALFIDFFVTCLKRLKSEFPELKIGGPALCWMNPSYFADLLKACQKAGVAPDFISWHYYGSKPSEIIGAAAKARKLCDSFGFGKCELIINEWHYLGKLGMAGFRSPDPNVQKQVWEGPASPNGIDSSCFTLSTLARLQMSEYDQAYFYGCRHTGAWGYKDSFNNKYKIWYALKLFGSLAVNSACLCASSGQGTVTTLATRSADGKTGWLLVSDYRGREETVTVDVKGARRLVSATLLDIERNNEPVDVTFAAGRLTLKKKLPGSAAFLVTFDLTERDPGATGDRVRLTVLPEKEVEEWSGRFARRIEEIRATPNRALSAGAVCRYLSGRGDDAADGLTPQTAWRTTARLNEARLEPGTFVLFERGCVFRGGVAARPGVTYTAYGKGPKPRLLVSPENAADPAKWEKTDVPDVWRYQAGKEDVGTLVFDGGRQHAVKIVPVYNKDGSFSQQYGGRPFNNGYADLAEDLHFWHDYSAKTRFKPHAKGSGYLYLRSKENPGKRFASIESCVKRHGIAVGRCNDVTVDNLCIQYVGSHGVGANGPCVKNLTVTDCEFGWIGGAIQGEYASERNAPVRYGNAVEIYGGCENYTVRGCYIHDVYDAGLTHQFGVRKGRPSVSMVNVRYTGNVIERCNYSIEYFLSAETDRDGAACRMENILFEGNLMRDAGVGYCEQRPDRRHAAHIKSWRFTHGKDRNRAVDYVIRNNVLWGSRVMLAEISAFHPVSGGRDSMPELTGNLFVGTCGQRFGVLNHGQPVEHAYDDDGLSRLVVRGTGNVFARLPETGRNPVLPGWYADPQIRRLGDRYWIFPTYSQAFAKQTFMDAFSSTDLKTWTKHDKVLKADAITWAHDCLWAPDIHEKDGKYYLFFAANEARPVENAITTSIPALQKMDRLTVQPVGHRKYGGIGVAVADRPEGPYRDLIGKPLIDQFWNKAQPIDQYVFRYKDEWYMIYGGWGRCTLVRLAPDFRSLLPLDDGRMWRDITPENYVEGSVMFERDGTWYFMYSSGSWTKDSYCVNYSTGSSPFGPFTFKGTVLASQRPLATGAGHHSVLNVPGTDDWYICYHRRPIPSLSAHHRVTCLDRLHFGPDGEIRPVVMTR